MLIAQAWVAYGENRFDDALTFVHAAVRTNPDIESGYYLMGRLLFTAGRYQEVLKIAEEAIAHAGENYNVYVPIRAALGALGKPEQQLNISQREIEAYEQHLRKVPEDARARVLLGQNYAAFQRTDDAVREARMAMALRPDDALILYNVACLFSLLAMKDEAIDALSKAWHAGYREIRWTRQDPDLTLLHGHPEFERLFPPIADEVR